MGLQTDLELPGHHSLSAEFPDTSCKKLASFRPGKGTEILMSSTHPRPKRALWSKQATTAISRDGPKMADFEDLMMRFNILNTLI
jgi:hypothetical protein